MPSLPPPARPLRHLQPTGLYPALGHGYSHAVEVREPVRWLWVAGQGGEDIDGQLAPSFELQAAQALRNLTLALAAGAATMADVVKISVLIVDHRPQRMALWQQALRQHWSDGVGENRKPLFPACTLIPVHALALPGMLIEVEAIAASAITSSSTPPAGAVSHRLNRSSDPV